jgi:ubiquinone biosynthesis protein COQ9
MGGGKMKTKSRLHPKDAHLIDVKRRLIAAALPHVVFDGWSAGLLVRAAEEAGVSSDDAVRAFPAGAIDAVAFWINEADRQMLEKLASLDLASMKIRERIATAVLIRLEPLALHRDAVRRALTLLALPQHAPRALKSLYQTADAIWSATGDTSTDWNFYSKRLLLSGVYSSTLLYWLDDRSEGGKATRAFLDRRISDVMQIQKLRGWVDRAGASFADRFGRGRFDRNFRKI